MSDIDLINALTIRPAQVKEEIREFLSILQKIRPKIILEIGTERGGTLFLLSQVADEDATLISIDLPWDNRASKGHSFGFSYPPWREKLYRSFARGNQKIYLLRGDSHSQATLMEVKRILRGRKLDVLFIDGDHTYEGVKKDFEMYSPLVKKGGIIAFHDIVPHLPETGCEVNKFWNEIKNNYKYLLR
ncbi:methyltransferase [Pyrodictium occultum]|uniref:Methyltransferase n=1 Tax=Pyrodictium occultum TaxID=2309 RepID=A0A0V8RRX3_PYROC|nr:methyltransferase [Pyrodictium occultum]